MSKTVYIGSAVGDENGQGRGGEPGNQTGRELKIEPWYLSKKGWIVLRPKDSETAKKLAYDMESACRNKNIGYDKDDRDTLRIVSEKVGYDCAKVDTPCECDCSSLVGVCCLYAGVKVSSFSTASEVNTLMKTGKFEKLTDAKYTEQSDYLKAGDILVTKVKGHTAIVINGGDKEVSQPSPVVEQPVVKAPYVLVLGSVNVRKIAPDGRVICIAHKGDKLPYLGKTVEFSEKSKWYSVSTKLGNGYISAFANRKTKYTKLIENE